MSAVGSKQSFAALCLNDRSADKCRQALVFLGECVKRCLADRLCWRIAKINGPSPSLLAEGVCCIEV